MMKREKPLFATILQYLLAMFMIYAGIQHFIKSEFYQPFVPTFLPYKEFFIFLSGVVEAGVGIMLLLKGNIAKWGALGVFLLMLAFLPIHIRDVIVDNPAIGSAKVAWVRLPIQFVFLAWSWAVYYYANKNSKA